MARTEIYHQNKQRAIAYLGGQCVMCGTNDSLEFDHKNRDRVGDENCITRLLGYGWKRIEAELQKCQLLCQDCHFLKTAAERRQDRLNHSAHGSATRWRYGCRCTECAEGNRRRMKEYHKKRQVMA